jgi:apolipoprotein D and lipocalin family protein
MNLLTLLPLCALLTAVTVSCASHPPLPTAESVDLPRFMGDWYVQAHIPAWGEGEAYNGVESYARDDDGRILTSYVFRKGGFDGPFKVMEPSAIVRDEATNAEWGMRFVWPFRAEFLIAYVDEGYTETIIGRTKRDYVWIMTREPEISDEELAALTERVREMGYDTSELRRVPQRWPDPEHPVSSAGGDLARYTRAQ